MNRPQHLEELAVPLATETSEAVGPGSALTIPLSVHSPIAVAAGCQPVCFGLPFSIGVLRDHHKLTLYDVDERSIQIQAKPLARWADGSVKWLLVEALAPKLMSGRSDWSLVAEPSSAAISRRTMQVRQAEDSVDIATGGIAARVDHRKDKTLLKIATGSDGSTHLATVHLVLTDRRGQKRPARIENLTIEESGPLRVTLRATGTFPKTSGLQFRCRFCFFAETGLVRARVTIHNPRRARHLGGLWDLGDAGSIFFRDLTLHVDFAQPADQLSWSTETAGSAPSGSGELSLYQDSSGGENWESRNHVNRYGRIPCRFRGYRALTTDGGQSGHRASPSVIARSARGQITAAVPDFWQQFPKGLELDHRAVRVRLFPGHWDDLFELQGGEQKTHTVWLRCEGHPEAAQPQDGTTADADQVLDWVHAPAQVLAEPAWYSQSGAIPYLLPADRDTDQRLCEVTEAAIAGPKSFFAKREAIDEYGWRNFGDVWGDHEGHLFKGEAPVISHYNNQFDVINGAILQLLRTADPRWREVIAPLARHVIDIDIYHTDLDKAAYNGGLFWHTDHYLDASTATHRTYSRTNRPELGSYGGGPGNEHNYATGLLHYYYLTGDFDARDAVLGLADWVIHMDDGSLDVLGAIDDGSTGRASSTCERDYHGPGRGAGNSIHVLLDAWLLSDRSCYLEKAEELIRRCIHPHDDIEDRKLLVTELRWSYTVFLAALDRYLDVKAQQNPRDPMYHYARASVLHYAQWMLARERPYLDRPEELMYVTEAWAVQELRKANVLQLAARHALDPLRIRLIARGRELSDRAWSDLDRFGTRRVTRAVAILMTEGTRDLYFRSHGVDRALTPEMPSDFPPPVLFISQRDRVKAMLRSPRGLIRGMWNLLTWPQRRARARRTKLESIAR